MPEPTLRDRRILVVEDEYMLADELRRELSDAEVVVLGPVGSVASALDAIRTEEAIDGAIVDINLQGEMAFAVADALIERGVPFAFTTGYDESALPTRFSQIVRCEKPVELAKVVQTVREIVHQ
jgi:DNA-binding NtrC family response regulator